MNRQEIIQELEKLVKSPGNDAVKLAWLENGESVRIGRLNLRCVTELKRSEKGCFEVKFIDRLKALELLERLNGGDGDELGAFLTELGSRDET